MKILAVSDHETDRVFMLAANGHFKDVDMIVGCGDLPYAYLENLVSLLNVPMMYIPGNHDPAEKEAGAEGGSNLDLKTERIKKFLICGFGGSLRYKPKGPNQYTQIQAFSRAFMLIPRLIANRVRFGRYLDILIAHSPPFGIHDDTDPAHTGLKALNWLIRFAKPRYLLHGHTHFYRGNLAKSESMMGVTKIINVYPYKIIETSH